MTAVYTLICTRLNKLETKEAFGPYCILQVDFKRGRQRVELKDDFTKGKSNEFSMEHVRRHWKQRPFKYDTLALDDRLDPSVLRFPVEIIPSAVTGFLVRICAGDPIRTKVVPQCAL